MSHVNKRHHTLQWQLAIFVSFKLWLPNHCCSSMLQFNLHCVTCAHFISKSLGSRMVFHSVSLVILSLASLIINDFLLFNSYRGQSLPQAVVTFCLCTLYYFVAIVMMRKHRAKYKTDPTFGSECQYRKQTNTRMQQHPA